MDGPSRFPGIMPIHGAGKEPLPPDWSPEEIEQYKQIKKWEKFTTDATESCLFKTVLAGGAGFAIGGFFSLMSASFAYEDPLRRQEAATAAGHTQVTQKASAIVKEMGKGMWTSGKGFAKVGALFSGIECVVESYRAKNDIYNTLTSGFLAGGILARNSGPKAAMGGGLAFAAFSAVIDIAFLRRETPDDD